MINTYQTSRPSPPVPPRPDRHQPAFASALSQEPASRHRKPVFTFLVGVVVVHLLLFFLGFIYLYHIGNKGLPSIQGRMESMTGEDSSYRPMARMEVVQPDDTQQSTACSTCKYLKWNFDQSVMREVNYYKSSWLTVKQPGDYYVYARVSFSRSHPRNMLISRVKLRKSNKEPEAGEERTLMKAYCSLGESAGLCTASQAEVVSLEQGDQISVWVDDPSLVDYEAGATTLGLYKM